MKPITAAILEQQKIVENALAEIARLVEACPHTEMTVRHDASTGNYDPSNNEYYKYESCPDCGAMINYVQDGKNWKETSRHSAKLSER